jgi:D-arabinose 1-dehydrogenase-like Zn-dependent alcohol dehydrogenase
MIRIKAYAIREQGGTVEPFLYERALGSRDALVRITHRSIARGDIQFMDNDWGDTRFPLVPGHEIVGIVEDVGAEVADLRRGDRVGVGYQQAACFAGSFCTQGIEQLCPTRRSLASTAMAAWPSTSSWLVGSPSGCRRSSIRPNRPLCSRPA